jgi:hypothetical protein
MNLKVFSVHPQQKTRNTLEKRVITHETHSTVGRVEEPV